MRLDKFIATNSQYSRADIAKLVKAGRVSINNVPASKTAQAIRVDIDHIIADGHLIKPLSERYLMVNKPAGYVCANTDNLHPTVIDLIQQHFLKETGYNKLEKLQIVGRLDIDTTGLVLVTTDGDWNHRVTAPSKKCFKRYLVETEAPISAELVDLFSVGLSLKNESKKTKPAILSIVDSHQAYLDIQEGKYHQVKRMFAACGNRVTQLHRVSIGNVFLDKNLKLGRCRELTLDEIQHFQG
ncbi:pseudouridine synthase [Teredinibacter haidensis]|uniref:pseudouridine synthase n=1 Tax=Teredinibacter haidensis TaxID=2731755 RepID=UPI00094892B0|nr:pseudouridine synthase [Teredinibacter haidensis]